MYPVREHGIYYISKKKELVRFLKNLCVDKHLVVVPEQQPNFYIFSVLHVFLNVFSNMYSMILCIQE